jgi:hypothetical protein
VRQKQNFKGRVFQKLKSKASLLIKANTKNTSSLTFLTFYPSLNNLKISPSNLCCLPDRGTHKKTT